LINKVFENDSVFIFDKPAGLVINRSDTTPSGTLQDYIEENFNLDLIGGSEFCSRSGIVHRLDKDTSGVILVAKSEEAFLYLKSQFQNRTVHKEYVALVHGKITDKLIKINAPIKRNPTNRMKMGVTPTGRPALTDIELVGEVKIPDCGLQEFSLLKAFPKTGRTHQIRVHLSALNHPVVGDKIYSTRKQLDSISDYFGRMMLHAHKITFRLPVNQETVTYEAPLPKKFLDLPMYKNYSNP